MQINVYEDRTVVGTMDLKAIDNSTFKSLVASVGERRAKAYIEAGVRQAANQAMSKKNGSFDPETWVPSEPSRARLSPVEKIKREAEKMGVSVTQLREMLAEA